MGRKLFAVSCLALIVLAWGLSRHRVNGSVAQGPSNVKRVEKVAQKSIRFSEIAYTGHGMLFRADGSQIELSKAVVEQLQDSLIEALTTPLIDGGSEKNLNPASIKGLGDVAAQIATSNLHERRTRATANMEYFRDVLNHYKFEDADERILVKALAIRKALEQMPKAEQAEMRWRSDLIFDRAIPLLRANLLQPTRQLAEFLVQGDLIRFSDEIRMRNRPTPGYIERCRDSGVPIPPDWPEAGWQNRGNLPWEFNFLANGRDTEVWTYETTQGICYSLPRKDGANFVNNGIICQSLNGKACFWDNLDASGNRLDVDDLPLRISELQNGGNLEENCTGCHRGFNVFIIHPNVAAMNRPGREPTVRYEPIGGPKFVNPPFAERLPGANSGACTACHEIADPGVGYCNSVLRNAANATMPRPGNPAGWTSPSAPYAAHIAALKARGCP